MAGDAKPIATIAADKPFFTDMVVSSFAVASRASTECGGDVPQDEMVQAQPASGRFPIGPGESL
jgi:hypothetical protein